MRSNQVEREISLALYYDSTDEKRQNPIGGNIEVNVLDVDGWFLRRAELSQEAVGVLLAFVDVIDYASSDQVQFVPFWVFAGEDGTTVLNLLKMFNLNWQMQFIRDDDEHLRIQSLEMRTKHVAKKRCVAAPSLVPGCSG